VFSFLPPAAAQGQTAPEKTRELIADEKPEKEQKRLALVLGNAEYQHTASLKNAANDAVDMTDALRTLDFEVMSGVNQSKTQMKKLIREFGEKLNKQGGVGLFFYAGHGVQYRSKNYLIPVDADIPVEDEVEDQAVDVNLLLAKMDTAKNDLNIIILDACRNNPFAKEWSKYRSMNEEDGLAKIPAPKGTVLFYATEPGKVASDGAGRNGLFTEVLLEQIKKPDVELDAMIKSVRRTVAEKSKNKQTPYNEGTNFNDFYFAKTPSKTKPNVPPLPAAPVKSNETEPNVTEKTGASREAETWNLVRNSTDAPALRIYLEEFPDGANAAKAKIKLEQILWDSIRTSRDKTVIQAHLKEFPNGANAPLARIRLRQLEVEEKNAASRETPTLETVSKETEPKETEPKMIATTKETKPKTTAPKESAPTGTTRTKKTNPAEANTKNAARSNAVGMEFVFIPAGSFMMGASPGNIAESLRVARKDYADFDAEQLSNEKPARRVTIGDGFWIGRYEVTQAQWTAVMGENPSNTKDCETCPVERVSWEDIKLFLQKLNEKDDGYVYRLPSEAEWEYSARAGTTGIFSGPIEQMAWHSGNSEDKTHPVGEKLPNPFGLYDIYGNVSEWCEDIYSPTYEGLPVDGSPNTSVGVKSNRVVRGGSWNNFPTLSRSTRRESYSANSRSVVIGFRVVAVQK
jgi:formylglycine-generating enzyme required for sulfatase activity